MKTILILNKSVGFKLNVDHYAILNIVSVSFYINDTFL